MKYLAVLAIIALASFSLYADGAETDVVRVFDPKVRYSKEEKLNSLKNANLERNGFKKTEQSTIETDENGDKSVKKTIYYMVKAKCSEAAYWEGALEKRFPAGILSSILGRKFVREIQSRIKGRGTKYCKIGLEIHLNRYRQDSTAGSNLAKRSVGKAGCWGLCFCAKIAY